MIQPTIPTALPSAPPACDNSSVTSHDWFQLIDVNMRDKITRPQLLLFLFALGVEARNEEVNTILLELQSSPALAKVRLFEMGERGNSISRSANPSSNSNDTASRLSFLLASHNISFQEASYRYTYLLR